MNTVLWVVLPYCAFTSCLVGHGWRWRHDRFGWNPEPAAREPRLRRAGLSLFRNGLRVVIIGRIVEFAISKTDSVANMAVLVVEIAATAVAILGAGILLSRRIANPARAGHTGLLDKMMLPLLAATALTGAIIMTEPGAAGQDRLVGDSVFPWFHSVVSLDPQAHWMTGAPLIVMVRALLVLALIAIWPYTRLIHIWMAPVGQLIRIRVRARESRRAGV